MAEQDSERNESATPHKLRQAREQGSVSKSADLSTAAMLAAGTGALFALGWDTLRQTMVLQQKIMARAGALDWGLDAVAAWLGQLLLAWLNLLSPLFLVLVVVAIAVNRFQVGAVFSFVPLKPDLQRINPAAGMKRLFTTRTLFDAAKTLAKLLVLGGVVYALVRGTLPGLIGLSGADARTQTQMLLKLCAALLAKLVLTMLIIGAADFVYSRWEFAKRMRMSKRDIRDEHKNREGDPRIRAQIRRLRREMLKRSASMRKLPTADVLITNPTHLAVALSYEHGGAGAPQVVAKGAGELARKMRLLAGRHQIPIVQNKQLARTLYREVDFDDYVPEKLYPQIAKIMIWVYSLRAARASGKAN